MFKIFATFSSCVNNINQKIPNKAAFCSFRTQTFKTGSSANSCVFISWQPYAVKTPYSLTTTSFTAACKCAITSKVKFMTFLTGLVSLESENFFLHRHTASNAHTTCKG